MFFIKILAFLLSLSLYIYGAWTTKSEYGFPGFILMLLAIAWMLVE
ncbi:MAG: hypothetical protein GF335_02735 [Candidatus Moranbacteria bacterium]|nr:hypothetical protein [Candidatus Moranbacteria bacterium]